MAWFKLLRSFTITPIYVETQRGWNEHRIVWDDVVLVLASISEFFWVDELALHVFDRSGGEIVITDRHPAFHRLREQIKATLGVDAIEPLWVLEKDSWPNWKVLWCRSPEGEVRLEKFKQDEAIAAENEKRVLKSELSRASRFTTTLMGVVVLVLVLIFVWNWLM